MLIIYDYPGLATLSLKKFSISDDLIISSPEYSIFNLNKGRILLDYSWTYNILPIRSLIASIA